MTNTLTRREQQATRLYGKSTPGTGSHDLSTANYYDRREASLRDDPERLRETRAERQRAKEFLQKYKLSPAAAQEAFAALRERDQHPRPVDAQSPHWAETHEHLRKAEGSSEAATALWLRAQKGADIVAREVPSLGQRAQQSGAVADPRTIRFLAAVADAAAHQQPTKE